MERVGLHTHTNDEAANWLSVVAPYVDDADSANNRAVHVWSLTENP